jgi:hypothetical protein
MKANAVACILIWSIILAIGFYLIGCHFQSNADTAAQADQRERERKQLKRKNTKALAAGVHTEQAQAASDTAFQQLRADYETDQRTTPGIGCVLDPVSLRRWNEANAQSDGAAASEPDGEVPAAAEGEAGGKRGQ